MGVKDRYIWDRKHILTNDEYFQRQFDMMINSLLDAMEHDPKRFLDKLRAYKRALEKPILKRYARIHNEENK